MISSTILKLSVTFILEGKGSINLINTSCLLVFLFNAKFIPVILISLLKLRTKSIK